MLTAPDPYSPFLPDPTRTRGYTRTRRFTSATSRTGLYGANWLVTQCVVAAAAAAVTVAVAAAVAAEVAAEVAEEEEEEKEEEEEDYPQSSK